jgi:hypothetical protein
MTSPGGRVLDLAHGAASTHILGALARLEIADHLAAGAPPGTGPAPDA